ncbi:MAG: 30S ribosomal protein S6 [Thermodesulfovibrionales bacterium]|nr:30S ribosomal protein S6 [Thermodesulfovibrionales bacterium]
MNFYEIAVILNPNLSEDEIKSSVEKISNIITSNGGEMLKVDNWGKRKLAYELNKQKFGLYIFFLFKSPSQTIKKIEDYFKVYDIVIKFLVIRLTKQQLSTLPKNLIADAPVNLEDVSPSKEG